MRPNSKYKRSFILEVGCGKLQKVNQINHYEVLAKHRHSEDLSHSRSLNRESSLLMKH